MYGFQKLLEDARLKNLSATEYTAFNDCPRRAVLTSRHGLNLTRAVGTGNEALEFGSLFHLALALYYSDSTKRSWEQVGRILTKVKPSAMETDWASDFKTVLSHYAVFYAGNDTLKNVLGVEMPFTYKLPQRGRIVGRVDAVVEINGQLWVVEHKTARSTTNVFDVAEFNMQSLIYVIAMEQTLGRPVAGMYYSAISKSIPRLTLLKDGSISKTSAGTDAWLRREVTRQHLPTDALERAGVVSDDSKYFLRFFHTPTAEQRKIFAETYIQQLYNSAVSSRTFPYRWNPIGCSYCGVKSLCRLMNSGATKAQLDLHIKNEYVQRTDYIEQFFAPGKALIHGEDCYWLYSDGELVKGEFALLKEAYDAI